MLTAGQHALQRGTEGVEAGAAVVVEAGMRSLGVISPVSGHTGGALGGEDARFTVQVDQLIPPPRATSARLAWVERTTEAHPHDD